MLQGKDFKMTAKTQAEILLTRFQLVFLYL